MTRPYYAARWTPEQDAIVRREWGKPEVSVPAIAQMVGHTEAHTDYRGRRILKLGAKPTRNTLWSAERKELLTQLWSDCTLSTREIGRRMGVSKNSVCGQAGRMGLPARRTPPGPKPAPKEPTLKRKPRLLIVGGGAVMHHAETRPSSAPPIKAKAWEPLPGILPVRRFDAQSSHCAWPITVDGDELGWCCGAVATEQHYCSAHHRMSRSQNQPIGKGSDKGLVRALRRYAA